MKFINNLLTIFPHYNAIENAQMLIERQRKILFYFFGSAIIFSLIFGEAGLSGPQDYWFVMQNRVYLFLTVAILALYYKNVIKLHTALIACIFLSQTTTSIEMIMSSMAHTPYHLMLIVGNMVLLAFNILFCIVAYFKNVAYILCVCSLAIYGVCVVLTKDEALLNFYGVYVVAFCLTGVMAHYLERSVKQLYQENNKLKADERDILRMLRTNKSEIKAYIEMARTNLTPQQTTLLLEMMTEDSKQTLLKNVKNLIKLQEADFLLLEGIFPELSPSELEICQLILQDKKLSEICTILNKNESNINSQRAHIRKKLNLQTSQNLKTVLTERLKKKQHLQ